MANRDAGRALAVGMLLSLAPSAPLVVLGSELASLGLIAIGFRLQMLSEAVR